MSAELELQKAIKAVIDNDEGVRAAFGGIDVDMRDYIPRETAMPYLCFGNHRADQFDVTPTETNDGYGQEHRIIIQAWSDHEGKKQIMDIIAAVRAALRDQPLELTGHHNATIRYQSADHGQEPDGQAYQGIIIFRAITEEL